MASDCNSICWMFQNCPFNKLIKCGSFITISQPMGFFMDTVDVTVFSAMEHCDKMAAVNKVQYKCFHEVSWFTKPQMVHYPGKRKQYVQRLSDFHACIDTLIHGLRGKLSIKLNIRKFFSLLLFFLYKLIFTECRFWDVDWRLPRFAFSLNLFEQFSNLLIVFGSRYSRTDQVKYLEDSL